MDEVHAVKWCAKHLDQLVLRALVDLPPDVSDGSARRGVTKAFGGDLQTLLVALPRPALTSLIEAWISEARQFSAVSGLRRAKRDEIVEVLWKLLVEDWRVPVAASSAAPVRDGAVKIEKNIGAPALPSRRAKSTWYTERWRPWVKELRRSREWTGVCS